VSDNGRGFAVEDAVQHGLAGAMVRVEHFHECADGNLPAGLLLNDQTRRVSS